MGVFKRGGKYWIDFYDSNRNRVQESSHSSSKRDAEALLALRKSEIIRGMYKRPAKITFGEFGTRYIALFALNTGLRIGEILSLKWEGVDLEKNLLTVFAEKTHKIRPVPINSAARRVLEFWTLGKKNEFVFYNHETGKPFVDLAAGFALACRKAEIEGVTWHTLRHVRVPAVGSRNGYSDSPTTAWTFDDHCNHALHAYESRCKTVCRREARRF